LPASIRAPTKPLELQGVELERPLEEEETEQLSADDVVLERGVPRKPSRAAESPVVTSMKTADVLNLALGPGGELTEMVPFEQPSDGDGAQCSAASAPPSFATVTPQPQPQLHHTKPILPVWAWACVAGVNVRRGGASMGSAAAPSSSSLRCHDFDEESRAALQVLRTLHAHVESSSAEQLPVSPRLDLEPLALQINARVKAFWDGLIDGVDASGVAYVTDGSGWYDGTIVGVTPRSASAQLRYAVRYDDGLLDTSVAPSHVRWVGSPERARAATALFGEECAALTALACAARAAADGSTLKFADGDGLRGAEPRAIGQQSGAYGHTSTNVGKTSNYNGVCWDTWGWKWRAQIRHAGKNKFLGNFVTEFDAARAYDRFAQTINKPLNFAPEMVSASKRRKAPRSTRAKAKPKPTQRGRGQKWILSECDKGGESERATRRETLIEHGGMHILSTEAAEAMRSFEILDMKPRSVENVLAALRGESTQESTPHDRAYVDLSAKARIGRYTLLERKDRVKRFLHRRATGNWTKKIK